MKAMNGFGASGMRRGSRLLGCMAALAALSAMLIAPSLASAKTKPLNATYVGLGDSLAFGYSQELFNLNKPGENPTAFEHGYVSDYYNLINGKKRTALVNYGCPGETTESLIGNNPAFLAEVNAKASRKVSEPITGESPCGYHKVGLPLHDEYGAGKSQLEAALETIALGKTNGTPVRTISLDIGANDELHAISKLKKEVEVQLSEKVADLAENEAERFVRHKLEAYATPRVEAWVGEHLIPETIIPAHYAEINGYAKHQCEVIAEEKYGPGSGPIVGPAVCASPYPPYENTEQALEFGYAAAVWVPAEPYAKEITNKGAYYEGEDDAINGQKIGEEAAAFAEQWGAEYAGLWPYTYEHTTSHKAQLEAEGGEKLIIGLVAISPALDTEIITNATAIMDTIKAADHKAKIIFVGTYNAYGNDYGAGEVLPHSNELLAALAGEEQAHFRTKPAHACFVDEQTLFNTGNSEEVTHMETWTNMANMNEFEYAPGKKLKFGQSVEVAPGEVLSADGPDIHATELGYKEMAKYMKSVCM
jgi:lysophospholipase L1-like esterase